MRCGRKLNLTNVDSEHLEEATSRKDPTKYHKAWETLSRSQGVSPPPFPNLPLSLSVVIDNSPAAGSRWLRIQGHRRNDPDGQVRP